MTRPRFLMALAVAFLAVASIAPWWGEVWLAVAYSGECHPEGQDRVNPRLPFLVSFYPDQVCWDCQEVPHQSCNRPPPPQLFELDLFPDGKVDCADCDNEVHGLKEAQCLCPVCYPKRQ